MATGGKVRAPKRTRYVPPKYPEWPEGTTGSGIWIGEALVGVDGKVARVWTIREVTIRPPLPAFNQAIVESVKRGEFEPALLEGRPVPVCMAVSVNIHWQ